MGFDFKKVLPHFAVLVLFVIISVGYFHPVLKGKTIFQSDIVQYTGMAKQQRDFQQQKGEETYWTNSAFGGMPTYQLGAKYPHNYIKKLDLTLRFLPRPADYLFLYFIGLYILLLVLKLDYKLAFLGAIAFGFSTYLIIILGVGHNAKAHAIAYMPLVLSGIILTFQGAFWKGFFLTAIAMALELVANHFQMTYYLLLLVICLGIAYLIDAYRRKQIPHYFKSVGIMALAVVLALGLNATNLLATKEYAAFSTRGKSEISINPDGSPKESNDGLSYDYITEYSYGKLETFNLLVPRFMGGGTSEPFPENSKTVDALMKMGASSEQANMILNQIPMYWGTQPIVAAPAYIGAVMIFLAVLALFLVRGRFKWWAVSGLLLSLLLSWGDNFSFLTELFIEYVPLYNKFRAVSSIQVLIELIIPILAMVGLYQFLNDVNKPEKRQKALLWSGGIVGGLLLIFLVGKSVLFDFASPYDRFFIDEMGLPFVDAIREDRMSLFTTDVIRSLVFVVLAIGLLWLLLKQKLKEIMVIGGLLLLIMIDLIGVDLRYVNEEDFVSERIMERPFQATSADDEVLKDEGYFRILDETVDPFNSGRASYFHNALGGYHAAKPGRVRDLYEFYIQGRPKLEILNMMNVKYRLIYTNDGQVLAEKNVQANGPAWFVESVIPVDSADDELLMLDTLNTKTTAVVLRDIISELPVKNIERDSMATIDLTLHEPNKLVYETASKTDQLAVFSEVYYPNGWNVYIDGEPATFFRANYLLRAMVVPAGIHTVSFVFEPKIVSVGSTYSLISAIILIILGLIAVFLFGKKRFSHAAQNDE